MTVLSKTLPYSCYELGHCWDPVCSKACFEIMIVSFIESCKIYGIVYLVSFNSECVFCFMVLEIVQYLTCYCINKITQLYNSHL